MTTSILPDEYQSLSIDELTRRIVAVKKRMGSDLCILGPLLRARRGCENLPIDRATASFLPKRVLRPMRQISSFAASTLWPR